MKKATENQTAKDFNTPIHSHEISYATHLKQSPTANLKFACTNLESTFLPDRNLTEVIFIRGFYWV